MWNVPDTGIQQRMLGRGLRREAEVSSPWRRYGWQETGENFKGAVSSTSVMELHLPGCWEPVPASWNLPAGGRCTFSKPRMTMEENGTLL